MKNFHTRKCKQTDRSSRIQAFSNFIHFIKFLERFFFLKQKILTFRKPDAIICTNPKRIYRVYADILTRHKHTYPLCLKTQLKRNKTNFLNSFFYVCLRIIYFNRVNYTISTTNIIYTNLK